MPTTIYCILVFDISAKDQGKSDSYLTHRLIDNKLAKFIALVKILLKKKYLHLIMLCYKNKEIVTEAEQHDILELLHRRRKKSSTIFYSQHDPSGYYDQLGGDGSPLAEAILDRIKHAPPRSGAGVFQHAAAKYGRADVRGIPFPVGDGAVRHP